MSLSTRRPPGIAGSVRPSRSASTARGEGSASRHEDDSPSSSTNKYRVAPQRSRSVPRQESNNPFRSRNREEAPPVPSAPSRHSVQSSVSSSSSRTSAVSAASTAPSSIWDYVGWKANAEASANGQEERIPSPGPAESRSDQADSGIPFWSRMVAAAGGLTVNVSKALEAKDDLPEPDTPPGCDSRVTTALKKHYIKRVSDPHQLPAWLFSDVERQVKRSYARTESMPTDHQGKSYSSANTAPPPVHSRARHGDAYARPQPTIRARREPMQNDAYEDLSARPTRAATRLRALRDAKRGSMERVAPVSRSPEPEPEPVEAAPVEAAPLPRSRVGLPGRPVRSRRDG